MADAHPNSVKYGTLTTKHPTWDGSYWKRLRALYSGKRKQLQEDSQVMGAIFPAHTGEDPDVYKERVARSLYICYAGQIIDFIVAALSSDPMTVEAEPEPSDTSYTDFCEDVSKPGGRKIRMDQFLRQQILTALICQRAWTLVDLPKSSPPDDEEAPTSLADQEASGGLRTYLCSIDPENVLDWEENDEGKLAWAMTFCREIPRNGIEGKRDRVREEYTYYTPEGWARYAVEFKADEPPKEDDDISLEDQGAHSFGKVPIIPLELTDGLWAMGKIEQLAVEHFNKRSALSWGQYRSLFQFLVANLGPMDPLEPVTDDASRAVNQRVGAGRVMVMGSKDQLQYIGPDSAPFLVAMQDLNNLRDEMHRVVHAMAMSVDNSGAALQRSGKSKALDSAVTTVVLKALGSQLREHAVEILDTVADGRGDTGKYDFSVHGLEEFDAMSVDAFLEEAATLNDISIESETFQREFKYMLAKKALGDNVDDDVLLKIRAELDDNITAESFMGPQLSLDDAAASLDVPPVKAPTVPPKKAATPPKVKAKKSPKAAA